MNVYVTGENGFLLKNLLPELKEYNIFKSNKKLNKINKNDLKNIDILLHFASPSESDEFKNIIKTTETIILDSLNLFNNLQKNTKIIYASSEGAKYPKNIYELSKNFIENYLIQNYNKEKYLILRIPRVYGKNRNKGLIKKLKNNSFKGNKNKLIEYMDINDWVKETLNVFNYNGIYEYKNKSKNIIYEIEKRYLN